LHAWRPREPDPDHRDDERSAGEGGTELSDRIGMFDINIGRWFQTGKVRIQPEIAIFNVFNNLAVYGVRSQNYLTSSYMQPSTILQARVTRIGLDVKW
jgi:hypothetical protein